jgi:hypothetical protein
MSVILAMSKVIPSIETPTTTTAYSYSQQTHPQDVRKDVRYQPISQSIDQSVDQINQTDQPVDQPASVIQNPAPFIQISPRQASLQPLYPHLPYNSPYAAINQPYHPYSQSPYGPINQYGPTNQYAPTNPYAFSEPPRSSYAINQIRFTPQASQSNLPQPIQPPAPQPPQPPQPPPPPPAPAPQSAPEPVHVNQSYGSNQGDFSRQLALLNKIYKKNEKFSDTSSNFDFKVLKFYDKCRRARLPEHAYLQSASIMLSDEALDYFYSNLQSCYSFHEFCVNIKHYFEDPE